MNEEESSSHKEGGRPNVDDALLEVLETVDKDDGKYAVLESPPPVTTIASTISVSGERTTEEPSLKRPDDETRVQVAASSSGDSRRTEPSILSRKRMCRFPGCQRVIKSQGHCQRHGARAKRCRIAGCDKQAQGTHDGMCKRHWKQMHSTTTDPEDSKDPKRKAPPTPVGESVYEHILPHSIAFRPNNALGIASSPLGGLKMTGPGESNTTTALHLDATMEQPQVPPPGDGVMPLVQYLHMNADLPAGWHRFHERRARGVHPVTSITAQLEPWERQLALMEILLMSGGTPYANFKDLSHAWGREKGFHMILANSVCERHGEVERKRRSDAGRLDKEAKPDSTATANMDEEAKDLVDDDVDEDDEDDDPTPGDAVAAMCNDEGAIGMILLDEMPTTNATNDNMTYEIAQV